MTKARRKPHVPKVPDGEGVTPERRQHGRIRVKDVMAETDHRGGTKRRYTHKRAVHMDMDVRWVEECAKDGRLSKRQAEAAEFLERKFKLAGYGGSPRSCLDDTIPGGEQSDGSAAMQAIASADIRTVLGICGLQVYTTLANCFAYGKIPREKRPEYVEWQCICRGLDAVADRFLDSRAVLDREAG